MQCFDCDGPDPLKANKNYGLARRVSYSRRSKGLVSLREKGPAPVAMGRSPPTARG